ncbi:radical SAM protein [Syntrophobacter fumaroxidans]|uniref:Radical SAM domain protein n=1 Tax=Syntrophobacter fumaroxidans (strain DSM 10017 / MPOB) TaxID=335543 RepID=A0LPC4_SYNFM|nr:Radical SAM domain protein [Syntrophobacter fumaroxidans MPOB]
MSPYVYGPVPSRRLGRSLGIDLVPMKTCTYDCLYCQLGKTTLKTTRRREWVTVEAVLTELEGHLAGEPDYITISGSGEPSLHSGLGSLISAIKAMPPAPVEVLTNSSLLWLPEVREALSGADLVIPSLDAGEDRLLRRVNRPHQEVTFHRMIDGLHEFRRALASVQPRAAFFDPPRPLEPPSQLNPATPEPARKQASRSSNGNRLPSSKRNQVLIDATPMKPREETGGRRSRFPATRWRPPQTF